MGTTFYEVVSRWHRALGEAMMNKLDREIMMANEKNLPKGWTEGTVEDLLGPSYPRRQTPEEIQEMLTPKDTRTCSYSTYPGNICATTKLITTCGWGETWDDEDHRFMRAEGRTCGGCGGTLVPCIPRPMTGREIEEEEHVVPAPAESMQEVCDRRAAEEGWPPGWISEKIADAKALENFLKLNEMDSESVAVSTDQACAQIVKSALAASLANRSAEEIEEMFDLDLHEPGAKADRGKLDYTLVPPAMEEAVCEIMMFGAQKYSRDGWRYVEDAPMRYLAALERHVKAFKAGEDNDPESGLHHLKHAACNIAFLLHFLSDGADIGYWRVLPGEDECPDEESHYNGA